MHKDQSLSDQVDLILQESKRIGFSAMPVIVIYLVATVGLVLALDIGIISERWALWVLLATVPLGYLLTVAMIKQSGLAPDGLQAGFWSYLILLIAWTLATTIGLLVLVVPGLIMIIRWAPLYGYGLVEPKRVGDAFGVSWEATGDYFWSIAVATIIPFLLAVAGVGIYTIAGEDIGFGVFGDFVETDLIVWQISLAANIANYLSTVTATAIGLAVYSLLRNPVGTVSDVFE